MSDSVIAIRTADRKLVPVLSGPHGTKRRMVLTTVHENQPSVHIDLFQMESEQDQQSDYIGSLVIEHLTPAPAGEPDITLNIAIDEQGNLNATATDSSSGDYQSLSVSLRDSDSAMQDLPDFSLSEEEEDLDVGDDFDLSGFDEPGLVDFEDEDEDEEEDEAGEATAESDFADEPDFSFDEDAGGDDSDSFEASLDDFADDDFADEGFAEESFTGDDFELPDLEDDAGPVPISVEETVSGDSDGTGTEGSVPKLLFVAYIVLAIAILTGLIFIVYRLLEGDPVPPLEACLPLVSPVGLSRKAVFPEAVRHRHDT